MTSFMKYFVSKAVWNVKLTTYLTARHQLQISAIVDALNPKLLHPEKRTTMEMVEAARPGMKISKTTRLAMTRRLLRFAQEALQ